MAVSVLSLQSSYVRLLVTGPIRNQRCLESSASADATATVGLIQTGQIMAQQLLCPEGTQCHETVGWDQPAGPALQVSKNQVTSRALQSDV